MENKVVGILKDISELVVGNLVEETSEYVRLNKPVLVGLKKAANGANVEPLPLSLLSIDPPFHVMNFLKNPLQEFEITLYKNRCLTGVLEMSEQLVGFYNTAFNTSAPAPQNLFESKPAEDNIVKLF